MGAEHEENIRIIPLIEKELEEVEAILEDMKYWRDDIEHEFEPDSLPFNFLSTSKVVTYLLILVPILLNVAFITLLERKILAFRQFRLGPNKVSWVGTLQPIADALKLFSKQVNGPFSSSLFIYIVSPVLSLLLILIIWSVAPLMTGSLSLKYRSVIIIIILRFGVYPLLLSG